MATPASSLRSGRRRRAAAIGHWSHGAHRPSAHQSWPRPIDSRYAVGRACRSGHGRAVASTMDVLEGRRAARGDVGHAAVGRASAMAEHARGRRGRRRPQARPWTTPSSCAPAASSSRSRTSPRSCPRRAARDHGAGRLRRGLRRVRPGRDPLGERHVSGPGRALQRGDRRAARPRRPGRARVHPVDRR